MDNQSPNYAEWSTVANGYVKNGKIVSTTPLYDSNGNFQLQANIPETQNSSVIKGSNPQLETIEFTIGDTQYNKSGSSEDVNETVTKTNSIGSFGNNTEQTTTGVLDTNATKSPNANVEPTNALEKAKADYDYNVATNNIQGQINALVSMSNIDGMDRTAQIKELTKQRTNKIMSQDNQFSSDYAYYMAIGDTENAQRVLQEQQAYRDKVGYADARKSLYEQEKEDIDIDYEWATQKGLNDIVGMLGQQFNEYINFQYDPYSDTGLQTAQAQAMSAVKEQMNATGMYYSSQTQYAITKACSELIPIYEQMAKDEIKENITMLQNIGSFLMNMEQMQFDMWKTQVNFQFEKADQKRKEIQDAWDRVELLGYVDNESAITLDVAPGTLSPSIRNSMIEKQNEIDKEQRALEQKLIIADYEQALTLQKMQAQSELDMQEAQYSAVLQRETNRQKALIDLDTDLERKYADFIYDAQLAQMKNQPSTQKIEDTITYTDEDGKEHKIKVETSPDENGYYRLPDGTILNSKGNKVTEEEINTINTYGKDNLKAVQDIIDTSGFKSIDLSSGSTGLSNANDIMARVYLSTIPEGQDWKSNMTNRVKAMFDELLTNDFETKTEKGTITDTTINSMVDAINNLYEATLGEVKIGGGSINKTSTLDENTRKEILLGAYSGLIDTIINADNEFKIENTLKSKNPFVNLDVGLENMPSQERYKEDAIINVITKMAENKDIPSYIRDEIAVKLSEKAYDYAKEIKDGYSKLKDKKYWTALNGKKITTDVG